MAGRPLTRPLALHLHTRCDHARTTAADDPHMLVKRRSPSEIHNPKPEITILLIALLVYLPLFLTLRADPTLLERGNQLSDR